MQNKQQNSNKQQTNNKIRNLSVGAGLPAGSVVKEATCHCRRHRYALWFGKIPHVEQLSPSTTTVGPVLWSLGAATAEPAGHNC